MIEIPITASAEASSGIPLGNAGPILVDELDEDFILMNGDLLMTIDHSDFFRRNDIGGATASIATFQKEVKIDLGVLETKDGELENHFTVSK
jgi:NDP-sugar pyrophosphorylase family protein